MPISIVERSADGASFTYVTKVTGVGNSSVRQYYDANDDHPYQGVNFYRLKQVDLDGKIHVFSGDYGEIRQKLCAGDLSKSCQFLF